MDERIWEGEGSVAPLMQRITGRESREEKWRGFCVDLVPLPNGWMVVAVVVQGIMGGGYE